MQKIPVTILTGFLGSGKTTLLQSLIAQAGKHGKRLAVLVNEFGDKGVDGALLKGCALDNCPENATAAEVVELPNGCVCCTVADEFLPAMQALLALPQRPDHIVIETSGLALPQPLVKAFAWPEMRHALTVDGIFTLVDAQAVLAGQFAADEDAVHAQRAADETLEHDSPLEEVFEDQLRAADIVILTKTDALNAAEIAKVEANVQFELAHVGRTGVQILHVNKGVVPIETLLGLGLASELEIANRPTHHELEGEEEHDHDDFETHVLPIASVQNVDAFLDNMRRAIAANDVFRAKGMVQVAGKAAPLVVQAVGERLEHYYGAPSMGQGAASYLVFIGFKGLCRTALETAMVA